MVIERVRKCVPMMWKWDFGCIELMKVANFYRFMSACVCEYESLLSLAGRMKNEVYGTLATTEFRWLQHFPALPWRWYECCPWKRVCDTQSSGKLSGRLGLIFCAERERKTDSGRGREMGVDTRLFKIIGMTFNCCCCCFSLYSCIAGQSVSD